MNNKLPYSCIVKGVKMERPTGRNGMEAIAAHFSKSDVTLKVVAFGKEIKLDYKPVGSGIGWVHLQSKYEADDLVGFWEQMWNIAHGETKMTTEAGTKHYVTKAEAGRYSRRIATAERLSWNR